MYLNVESFLFLVKRVRACVRGLVNVTLKTMELWSELGVTSGSTTQLVTFMEELLLIRVRSIIYSRGWLCVTVLKGCESRIGDDKVMIGDEICYQFSPGVHSRGPPPGVPPIEISTDKKGSISVCI